MTETMINPHWIALEGAFNVRDTGNYPADGGTTRPNALLRADSLHKLTQADQDVLLARGLRTVIDLRHAQEVSVAANVFAESDVVVYHSLPIFPDQADTTGVVDDLPTIYRFMVDSCQGALLRALQAIAQAPEGGVLIHCSAGKDRTGILTALALSAVGVPREFIIEDYALTTEGMKRLRPQLLSNSTMSPEVLAHVEKLLASDPELLIEFFEYFDSQHGGIDTFLDRIGFSPADRDLLRNRLVQPYEETSHV